MCRANIGQRQHVLDHSSKTTVAGTSSATVAPVSSTCFSARERPAAWVIHASAGIDA